MKLGDFITIASSADGERGLQYLYKKRLQMHRLPMKLAAAAWLIAFSTGAFAQAAQSTTPAGYGARIYSTNGWQSLAHRIADKYSRGHRDIIVIIGHSLGGNATFDIANQLDRQNIPIELVVTFDATRPQPVPKNILHLVNFYQENGFGKLVSAGPEFKGELTNIDLTTDTGLSHTTIEKSPRLHLMVMKKIEDVVRKDLASKIKATKPKTKRQKSNA
jgi:hypothetical protein